MPISTYADYVNRVADPIQYLRSSKNAFTVVAGRMYSTWLAAPDAGVAPTAPVVPTRATAGAIRELQNSATAHWLAQVELSSVGAGALIIADRLSHQGGLSGTVTTPQTTNLPTAALTRYVGGLGVFAALEIYTAIGTTATTVTVSYTNQAGATGRVSQATDIGAAAHNQPGRLIMLPLADGDTGVRSVESVTVLATTGTAGNFGVTLFRPLMILPISALGAQQRLFDGLLGLGGNLPTVLNDACLQFLYIGNATTTGIIQSELRLIAQ